jgi:hypothetical protein
MNQLSNIGGELKETIHCEDAHITDERQEAGVEDQS